MWLLFFPVVLLMAGGLGRGIGIPITGLNPTSGGGGPGAGADDLLMETGDHLLLETGDAILLE